MRSAPSKVQFTWTQIYGVIFSLIFFASIVVLLCELSSQRADIDAIKERLKMADEVPQRGAYSPNIGLMFAVPSRLDASTSFTESSSTCATEGSGLVVCPGSTFRFETVGTEKISVCGSTGDFTQPRGGYYCDDAAKIRKTDAGYVYDGRWQKGISVKPTKVYPLVEGEILYFEGQDVAQLDPSGMSGYPSKVALIPLKSEKYPMAWMTFVDDAPEKEVDAVLRSIVIDAPGIR